MHSGLFLFPHSGLQESFPALEGLHFTPYKYSLLLLRAAQTPALASSGKHTLSRWFGLRPVTRLLFSNHRSNGPEPCIKQSTLSPHSKCTIDYTLNPHLFIPDTFNPTLLTKKTVRAVTLMRERGELKEAVSPEDAVGPGRTQWAQGGCCPRCRAPTWSRTLTETSDGGSTQQREKKPGFPPQSIRAGSRLLS